MFGKTYQQLTRNDYWIETVEIVQNLIKQNCLIKKPRIKKLDKIFFDENIVQKALVSRRGRYGGTWLHQDLAIAFVRMLDVRWGFELDMFMKNLIRHTDRLIISRENTKIKFHPLTDTIKDIWIPKQTQNGAKWAYKILLDLASLKALGITSKDYRSRNKIPNDKSIRDYMTKDELSKIEVSLMIYSTCSGFKNLVIGTIINSVERSAKIAKTYSELLLE